MLEVKFQNESVTTFNNSAKGGIIGWVMRTFGIQSEGRAIQIIIGFVIFCIVISIFMVINSGSKPEVIQRRDTKTGQPIMEGRRPGYF